MTTQELLALECYTVFMLTVTGYIHVYSFKAGVSAGLIKKKEHLTGEELIQRNKKERAIRRLEIAVIISFSIIFITICGSLTYIMI